MLAGVLTSIVMPARADSFGTVGNEFTIDFVNIGNVGNANDPVTGYGGVSYAYRMGSYEVSQAQIDKASASGLANVVAGAWAGNRPAANMTWYEMAAFVNYLNTSTGHHAAYNLAQIPPDSFGNTWLQTLWSSAEAWQLDGENLHRHKDAYYFLPGEDEWYKAAFHKNDGVTANYWLYATGSNTAPAAVVSGTTVATAVYGAGAVTQPTLVNSNGGLSPYGTSGQNGNVWEELDTPWDSPTQPIIYDNTAHYSHVMRGAGWENTADALRSYVESAYTPWTPSPSIGFRVASIVPEPSSAILLLGVAMPLLLRRRRGSAV